MLDPAAAGLIGALGGAAVGAAIAGAVAVRTTDRGIKAAAVEAERQRQHELEHTRETRFWERRAELYVTVLQVVTEATHEVHVAKAPTESIDRRDDYPPLRAQLDAFGSGLVLEAFIQWQVAFDDAWWALIDYDENQSSERRGEAARELSKARHELRARSGRLRRAIRRELGHDDGDDAA